MTNITWFIDRVGQTVKRVYENNETEFKITEKNVGYLQQFTEKGYMFVDENNSVCTPLTAGQARPRLHVGGSSCISCEG